MMKVLVRFGKNRNYHMRITKINIPESNGKADGLNAIHMDRLNSIVLIAGKNGSGKTRILNKIFSTIATKPKKYELDILDKNIESKKNQINSLNSSIDKLNKQISKNQNSLISARITEFSNRIKNYENEIIEIEKKKIWKFIETNQLSDNYAGVHFVPKRLDLKDSNSFAKDQIISHAKNINIVGVNLLPDATFAKIQFIQDRYYNVTHQDLNISEEDKSKGIEDYKKLEKVIEIFLGTKVGRTLDGEATLFGFPMGKSNLSDGQKILLQFCIAIYSQETALKDLILVLDEPENHLHPSVIIETIERIQNCVTNGQIWIATHSIPLLAHFDPSLIWYVEENKIEHAGKIPEKVLNSLLGGEDEVAKLQDFISLPAQYASSRYAFECLFEPNAISTESNDPQSIQIRQDLLKHSKDGVLRILDYGAGKGRLISNLIDLDEKNKEKLIEHIDYIAFDKFNNDKEYCERSLEKAYGDCSNRYYNDMTSLLSKYDKGSFDVVIMCNVLHEIDPKEWLKLFQKDGVISTLLKETGILLLVEDHQIPIGEKAYQKGFLVLDTPQLKELFKITETDSDFVFKDFRNDGRLKAHQIPKRCLEQIDEKSRLDSLKSMSTNARENILKIRDEDKNYKNGKLHGFWTQQFANAQLNLAELSVS